MARFAAQRVTLGEISQHDLRFQLFYSYLLPQFEGVSDDEARQLWKHSRKQVGAGNRERLRATLNTVLGINVASKPASVENDGDEEDELDQS